MNESVKTKKALRGSLFALFLCIVLLIGTTFAWFTDSVSTGVNKIQAGNLKVGLEKKTADGWVDATQEGLQFVKAEGHEGEAILWEPGCTYELPQLRVVNKGNLALKYKVQISGIKGDAELNDVIDWTINDDPIDLTEQHLKANENGTGFTIKGHMQETAGNNYQDKSIDGVRITVVATQNTVESDSFNNEYDKNAAYPTAVSTVSELTSAVENGGYIVLKDDIELGNNRINVPSNKDVTIDLNGKTVNVTKTFANIESDGKLTISGGTVNASRAYVFNNNGGEVVVNGGNFTAQEAVCALFGGSKLTVNGGTFTSKDNSVIATNGSAKEGCEITVNGGVFNANIQTKGYIACGVYVANKDTVHINGGTFNINNGIGVMMRAGNTTIGKNVVIKLNNDGTVKSGKIGDANIDITTPGYLVVDTRSHYPGLDSSFNVTNNSKYSITEYK